MEFFPLKNYVPYINQLYFVKAISISHESLWAHVRVSSIRKFLFIQIEAFADTMAGTFKQFAHICR